MSKRIAQKGDTVMPGELVGLVGNTGHSFGSHLHLEIQKSGTTDSPIDPMPWLRKHGLILSRSAGHTAAWVPASTVTAAVRASRAVRSAARSRLTPSSPPKSTSACVLSPSPRVRTTVPRP